MGGYAIKAQFEANCPLEGVMKWLNTQEGIAGWWSDKVEGSAGSPGDEFHVTFPTSQVVFDLEVREVSAHVVEWHVPENPPWWKGTTIRFELSKSDDGTNMLFTHFGFDEDDPIIAVITPAWVRFLDNLVSVAGSGKANPAVAN